MGHQQLSPDGRDSGRAAGDGGATGADRVRPVALTAPVFQSDFTRRFTFESGRLRGEQVSLDAAWRQILARRPYPEPLARALGELVAASVLFTATLKTLQSDGRLTLQIQGGSPVSLLVVECGASFDVRATAQWPADAVFAEESIGTMASGGRCVLTIDPGGDYEAYQSIVPLAHHSVAAILDSYMTLSEQIPSRFALAANRDRVAGVLVQELPRAGGRGARTESLGDPDLMNRVSTILASLAPAQMLGVDPDTLLRRCFLTEEDAVRVQPPRPLRFQCRCSMERIEGVLKILGENEMRGLLADQGSIDIGCDFCGERYVLTADEAWSAYRKPR